MSDNAIHIVPIHTGDYPNVAVKVKEILQWFQEREMIETTLSECTLGQPGYRFKPAIASIFKDEEQWSYSPNLLTQGLEITYGKRTVFCPAEGMYLIISCPNCQYQFPDEDGFNCITNWYDASNDSPKCPKCKQKRHLTEYQIDPDWAFSNIGITLWNTHWNFKPEFLKEMEQLFGMPVQTVEVRI